jgi:hypothetical protein
MAIAFDAQASGKNPGVATLSYSHTIGGGANRFLHVGVAWNGSAGSISGTYNGVALVFGASSSSSSTVVYHAYLLDGSLPAAGAHTVSITHTGSPIGGGLMAGSVSLTGVKQVAPEATATNSNASATSISSNITTLTADAWVFDVIGLQDTGSALVAGGSQTERGPEQNDTNMEMSTSTLGPVNPAGVTAMSWTWTTSASVACHVLVAVAPDDGTPPMPSQVFTYRGSFTTPAGTGNQAYTGLGFRPKALRIYAVPVTNSSANADACHMMGLTDFVTQGCVLVTDQAGASNTSREEDLSEILRLRNGAQTLLVLASVVSADADGFTLNYTTTGSGYIIHVEAFGGTDLLAERGTAAVSAGSVTGLAFQPQIVFAISFCDVLGDAPEAFGSQTLGVFNDNLDEHALSTYQGNDASDQTILDSRLRTTGFLSQINGTTLTWESSVTAITANGFTWSGTNADGFHYLALNVGNLKTFVGSFTKAVGAAPVTQALPDFGFRPQIYGLMSGGKTTEGIASSNSIATVGSFDRTRQGHTFRTSVNNSTNVDQRSSTTDVFGIGTVDASYNSLAAAQPVVDSTPDVSWDPNIASAYIIGVWAIEESNIDRQLEMLFGANH